MGRKKYKRWDSCLLWFAASLGALCLTVSRSHAAISGGEVEDGVPLENFYQDETKQFPAQNLMSNRKLILVSTLDGKLSALDVQEEGHLLWSIPADSRPLLSSSIHNLEIMHEGVPTRYIPSLDGGLYRYDGESIEAVPLTADTLLSSSFKLADNTMMIGGKDLVTYGINPHSGQVKYACGVKGCRTFGEQVLNEEDLLVVNRQTQTVRAVDSRSGSEKWNFSVGEHELTYIKGQRQVISGHQGDCEEDTEDVSCDLEDEVISDDDMEKFSSSVKIVVPEGMVVGVDPDNMQAVTWKYKFKSPVSNVWLLHRGKLQQIDMFGNNNIPALSSFEPGEQPMHPPLLYVGMHDKQLYVQPSAQMQERMTEAADRLDQHQLPGTCQRDHIHLPRVAWKPYLNTAQWRTPSMYNDRSQITAEPGYTDVNQCEGGGGDGGLVIWHENYPFDNGFYLYPEFTLTVQAPEDVPGGQHDRNHSHEPTMFDEVMSVPVTLWTWWKEVIAISILTSVIVNIIINRVHRAHAVLSQSSSSSQFSVQDVSETKRTDIGNHANVPSRQNSDEYISRYATDFDHMEVLGRGGFGVVFEATNKVDECHYAIKRIDLPNSDGAKEKVMREVKALAKLEHVGIVRFYHAWIESPPPGWQEEKDQLLEYSEGATSQSVVSYTRSPSPIQQGPPPISEPNHGGDKTAKSLGAGYSASPLISELDYVGCRNTKETPKKLVPSPFDLLKNPLGGKKFDFSESGCRRFGSEEFSVHSDSQWGIDKTGSEEFSSGTGIPKWHNDDDESGSFSCGMGTPNSTGVHIDDSVEIEFRLSDDDDDEQLTNNNNKHVHNIPSSSDSASVSDGEQHEHFIPLGEANSSFQIVYEDSGCGDKSSKDSTDDVCISMSSKHSEISEISHPNCAGLCRLSSSVGSKCSCPKPHSHTKQTHSRTHSCSHSRDFTSLTIEKETNKTLIQDSKKMNKLNKLHKPKLFLYIQMQLCKRDTLKDWLATNTLNRDRHNVLDMFDQIVSAIEYVHNCGLMHRDLKPSNIFFSVDGVIKLGDFGLVTALPEEQNAAFYRGNPFRKHTAQVGTQLYMSPEQTSGKVYSQKVDIYSLGVILFEMLYPFATQMERVSTLLKVREQIFPERFNREMHYEAEFVKWLLSPKAEDRPSAKEMLSSDLLKDFESRRMPQRFRMRTVSQNSS